MAIARMWQSKDSTNMGVPVPGVELKLVPTEGKLEARLRGPNILPGYWRQRELTARAFDDEGFYKLGDALKFEDPGDPRAGSPVRRPRRRRLQTDHRHLGECWSAARPPAGAARTLCARRRHRRRRSRRDRRA